MNYSRSDFHPAGGFRFLFFILVNGTSGRHSSPFPIPYSELTIHER